MSAKQFSFCLKRTLQNLTSGPQWTAQHSLYFVLCFHHCVPLVIWLQLFHRLPYILAPTGHVHADGSLRGAGSLHAAHTHPGRTDPRHQTHPGLSGGDLQVTQPLQYEYTSQLQRSDITHMTDRGCLRVKPTFVQVAHTHCSEVHLWIPGTIATRHAG